MTKSISSFVKTVSNAIYKTLYAQALQNKPGGMLIGGNHFGGQGSVPMGGQFNNSGPRGGGGYMDRSGGRDDYRVSIF